MDAIPAPETANKNPDEVQYNDENASIPKYPGFLWKFETAHPTAYSIADSDFPSEDPNKEAPAVLIAASKKAAQFRYNHYSKDAAGNSM